MLLRAFDERHDPLYRAVARPPLDPPADATAETPETVGAALAKGGGLLATLEVQRQAQEAAVPPDSDRARAESASEGCIVVVTTKGGKVVGQLGVEQVGTRQPGPDRMSNGALGVTCSGHGWRRPGAARRR